MIGMVENNVSYSSTDGNHHLQFHHLFCFLRAEIMVDCTMPHYQIYANHFDVMFPIAPESNTYGIRVVSMVMLEVPDFSPHTDRVFRSLILLL